MTLIQSGKPDNWELAVEVQLEQLHETIQKDLGQPGAWEDDVKKRIDQLHEQTTSVNQEMSGLRGQSWRRNVCASLMRLWLDLRIAYSRRVHRRLERENGRLGDVWEKKVKRYETDADLAGQRYRLLTQDIDQLLGFLAKIEERSQGARMNARRSLHIDQLAARTRIDIERVRADIEALRRRIAAQRSGVE
ncbi:hypothetical protein JXA32_05500 [Candidatus Sumerlaeota bacterium]|nr:hypothetical protein [Candidatus Sumerlaeota bacterium]